jgi:hypothetical protein
MSEDPRWPPHHNGNAGEKRKVHYSEQTSVREYDTGDGRMGNEGRMATKGNGAHPRRGAIPRTVGRENIADRHAARVRKNVNIILDRLTDYHWKLRRQWQRYRFDSHRQAEYITADKLMKMGLKAMARVRRERDYDSSIWVLLRDMKDFLKDNSIPFNVDDLVWNDSNSGSNSNDDFVGGRRTGRKRRRRRTARRKRT